MAGRDHLVVPYTLDTNDMKYVSTSGFPSGDEFFTYLRDAFDVLYAEGVAGGLRRCCRWVCTAGSSDGPPASPPWAGFSTTCRAMTGVWIARRVDVARHWEQNFPPGA